MAGASFQFQFQQGPQASPLGKVLKQTFTILCFQLGIYQSLWCAPQESVRAGPGCVCSAMAFPFCDHRCYRSHYQNLVVRWFLEVRRMLASVHVLITEAWGKGKPPSQNTNPSIRKTLWVAFFCITHIFHWHTNDLEVQCIQYKIIH